MTDHDERLPTPTIHWKAGDPLPEGWTVGENVELVEVYAGRLKPAEREAKAKELMERHGVPRMRFYPYGEGEVGIAGVRTLTVVAEHRGFGARRDKS